MATAADEDELRDLCATLEREGIPFYAWEEPDLNNQLTAIATGPITGSQRKLFRRFPLLREPSAETVCTREVA